MNFKRLIGFLLLALMALQLPAFALTQLYDSTITEAVRYGMENQDYSLSTFLGGNWREGTDGTLLNIYTPFMDIARATARHNFGDKVTPESVAVARKKVKRDIDYVWQHPTVKFMVSMYGDTPGFAANYYAVVEGVGKGRSYRILPYTMTPQTAATKEADVKIRPYTAINAYYFKYDDIAPLDEFQFKLYGKNVTPISFRIVTKDIQ